MDSHSQYAINSPYFESLFILFALCSIFSASTEYVDVFDWSVSRVLGGPSSGTDHSFPFCCDVA